MDCTEWQKIGIKAAAWVDKRDGDPTTVTWEEVFLDLTTTYDAIFAYTRSRSFGGDPTGPAARTAKFPVGVGFQGMGFQAIEMRAPDGSSGGEWDTDYRLAVYEATFGKLATVLDYTQLVEQRRPPPGSIRIASFTAKKDGQFDFKKKGSFDASFKDKEPVPTRMFVPTWQCGHMMGRTMCAKWNQHYVTGSWNKSDTSVGGKSSACGQLKRENSKSGNNKHTIKEPSLGAAAIERLIEDRVASSLQKAIDAHKTSDESVMAGFAQADYSGNVFSLGLSGIVAESISSLNDDGPCFPEDGNTIIDQFGNNADAYLRRGTNHSGALAHQVATMSYIVMFLSGIHGFAFSVTNRLGQACSSVMTWLTPAAGGRHATTARMCILIACCVLFTQLASTQALRPHTINAIGARHAIENWGIELSPGNATRYGLKHIAQSHQQYCLQTANRFATGQLFLDSGASTTLIHDVSMLVNVRCLSESKMVMGLTGD